MKHFLQENAYRNFFQIRIIWKSRTITRYYPIEGCFRPTLDSGEKLTVDEMLSLINKPNMQLSNIATTNGFIITYREV